MRVLQIIYESYGNPFGFGGAGIRAYEIYKRLKERHEITLLCMRYPGAKDGEIEGLRHIFVGAESNSLTRSVLAYTLKASQFVRRCGKEFDVIIENFLPSTPFFTIFITKSPVVLQVQDFWGRHTFSRFPIHLAIPMSITERYYPKLYNRFIFVSEVTRAQFSLGGDSVVIPNGIDQKLLELDPKPKDYVLFISSIDLYKKGLDVLLKAFERVSQGHPNVSLFIAGTGRDIERVKAMAGQSPVSEKVRFLGWLSGEQKARYISESLFTVLPSRHESQPISIIEAAACGKAVLVSDIEELGFVRENGFGLTFKSGSADDLAKQLATLLEDPHLRERLGNAGRKYASAFTWDKIAVQFESYLGQAAIRS